MHLKLWRALISKVYLGSLAFWIQMKCFFVALLVSVCFFKARTHVAPASLELRDLPAPAPAPAVLGLKVFGTMPSALLTSQ